MLDKFYPITYRTDLSNYEINKRGQVRSKITNKILSGTNNRGYKHYTLKDNNGKLVGVLAHVMVANEFIPNPENKPIINHIDENGMNACIDNLEWVTHKENSNHGTCGKRSANKRQYPLNQYSLDGRFIRTWKNSEYPAYVYGVDKGSIMKCANGQSSSIAGYIWRKYDGSDGDIIVRGLSDHCISIQKTKVRNGKSKERNPILPEYLYEETPDTIINYLQSMPYIPKADKEMLERLRKMCS